jgi:gliding motility-associated-like protein
VPNAFSPNDDGVNDRLQAFASEGQAGEVAVFRIFDRWGALVYEAAPFALGSTAQGWDGRIRGELAAPGAYAYYLRVNFASGDQLETSGAFTLVR